MAVITHITVDVTKSKVTGAKALHMFEDNGLITMEDFKWQDGTHVCYDIYDPHCANVTVELAEKFADLFNSKTFSLTFEK